VAKGERVGGKVKEVSAAGGGFGVMLTEVGNELLGMLGKLGLLDLAVKFVRCLRVRAGNFFFFFWQATELDRSARCLILKRWEPNKVHHPTRAKSASHSPWQIFGPVKIDSALTGAEMGAQTTDKGPKTDPQR
jgi:hypothetical protein